MSGAILGPARPWLWRFDLHIGANFCLWARQADGDGTVRAVGLTPGLVVPVPPMTALLTMGSEPLYGAGYAVAVVRVVGALGAAADATKG